MSSKIKKEIISWAKTILFSVVIAYMVIQLIVPTIVSGESMYPTLNDRDYLIIDKISYKLSDIEKGDIVVFKTDFTQENGERVDYIKRVIATEGDHIEIENSNVYVNGELLQESYINNSYTDGMIDTTVPKGTIFAMGDNRQFSKDSRMSDVGMILEENIIGKVMVRLLPFNNIGIPK